VGGYDEKAPFHTREDWYFWLDLLDAGFTFIHLAEYCFEYRFLENSKVRSRFADPRNRLVIYQYIFSKQKRLIEKFSEKGELDKEKARKMLSDLYWQLAYYELGYGSLAAGYSSLFSSLKLGQPVLKIMKTALAWPLKKFRKV
jgi:hypothetical protein